MKAGHPTQMAVQHAAAAETTRTSPAAAGGDFQRAGLSMGVRTVCQRRAIVAPSRFSSPSGPARPCVMDNRLGPSAGPSPGARESGDVLPSVDLADEDWGQRFLVVPIGRQPLAVTRSAFTRLAVTTVSTVDSGCGPTHWDRMERALFHLGRRGGATQRGICVAPFGEMEGDARKGRLTRFSGGSAGRSEPRPREMPIRSREMQTACQFLPRSRQGRSIPRADRELQPNPRVPAKGPTGPQARCDLQTELPGEGSLFCERHASRGSGDLSEPASVRQTRQSRQSLSVIPVVPRVPDVLGFAIVRRRNLGVRVCKPPSIRKDATCRPQRHPRSLGSCRSRLSGVGRPCRGDAPPSPSRLGRWPWPRREPSPVGLPLRTSPGWGRPKPAKPRSLRRPYGPC